jgi:hypothetical protein
VQAKCCTLVAHLLEPTHIFSTVLVLDLLLLLLVGNVFRWNSKFNVLKLLKIIKIRHMTSVQLSTNCSHQRNQVYVTYQCSIRILHSRVQCQTYLVLLRQCIPNLAKNTLIAESGGTLKYDVILDGCLI